MEHKSIIRVAFEHRLENPEDYSPQSLAEEVFDCDQAGLMHREDPDFSLNLCDARIEGRWVVVPVEGASTLTDIEGLSRMPLLLLNGEGQGTPA